MLLITKTFINERKYIMSYEYFIINVRNKLEVLLKENYKITSELKNLIESKLCERWSLEQIIGREQNGKLSSKRILPKAGDELPEASLSSNLL